MALAERIGERSLAFDPRDTDRYGRVLAVSGIEGGDPNAWVAREGHAVAFRRYGEDDVNARLTAKALRTGIWAGPFREPTERRRPNVPGARTGGQRS
ncbi:thermonuclease family protein [Methylobacterium sp. Leaf399]|uniref:thermonuclease family protein n=1 Tax=Methylobacterium sp. Leaf399 TaxID=1736364 RepID=UPI0030834A61